MAQLELLGSSWEMLAGSFLMLVGVELVENMIVAELDKEIAAVEIVAIVLVG